MSDPIRFQDDSGRSWMLCVRDEARGEMHVAVPAHLEQAGYVHVDREETATVSGGLRPTDWEEPRKVIDGRKYELAWLEVDPPNDGSQPWTSQVTEDDLFDLGYVTLARAREEKDRLLEVVEVKNETIRELQTNQDTLDAELERYGIPATAPLSGLLQHIYNNRDLVFMADAHAIKLLEEKLEASEHDRRVAEQVAVDKERHNEFTAKMAVRWMSQLAEAEGLLDDIAAALDRHSHSTLTDLHEAVADVLARRRPRIEIEEPTEAELAEAEEVVDQIRVEQAVGPLPHEFLQVNDSMFAMGLCGHCGRPPSDPIHDGEWPQEHCSDHIQHDPDCPLCVATSKIPHCDKHGRYRFTCAKCRAEASK